jgi:hypothetical protein
MNAGKKHRGKYTKRVILTLIVILLRYFKTGQSKSLLLPLGVKSDSNGAAAGSVTSRPPLPTRSLRGRRYHRHRSLATALQGFTTYGGAGMSKYTKYAITRIAANIAKLPELMRY